jgi:hypothetical protein
MGEWRYNSTILNLDNRWWNFMPLQNFSGEGVAGPLWKRCWVGPRASMGATEKRKLLLLQGIEHKFLCCPVCTDRGVNIITKIFTACNGETFVIQKWNDDGYFMFRSVAVSFNRCLHIERGVRTVQHISKWDWFPQLLIEHRPYIIMMENVKSVNFLKTYVKGWSVCWKEFYILGPNAMQSFESQLTFRRNMSYCFLPASCLFLAWLILRPWRCRWYVTLKC